MCTSLPSCLPTMSASLPYLPPYYVRYATCLHASTRVTCCAQRVLLLQNAQNLFSYYMCSLTTECTELVLLLHVFSYYRMHRTCSLTTCCAQLPETYKGTYKAQRPVLPVRLHAVRACLPLTHELASSRTHKRIPHMHACMGACVEP